MLTTLQNDPGLVPSPYTRWLTAVIPVPGDRTPFDLRSLYAPGAQKLMQALLPV